MTKKQIEQFNRMRSTLRRISSDYMTPSRIERDREMRLGPAEYLEMAYENIQAEAAMACKGVREIK